MTGNTRGIVVVKVGGALLEDAAAQSAFLDAVAAVHRATPGRLVLVHGGGVAIERHLARAGFASEKRHGIRVTPPDQIPTIAGALCGEVNGALVAALAARDVRSSGLRLLDGGLARCERVDPSLGVGEVGQVVGGDPAIVRALLHAGALPVIATIGATDGGALLNVNADDAAAAIAGIVGASRLALLTDVDGVRGPDGAVAASLDEPRIAEWTALGVIHGGMLPKVRGALEASRACGAPVVIASWRAPEALAELVRGGSAGTLIRAAAPGSVPENPQEVLA